MENQNTDSTSHENEAASRDAASFSWVDFGLLATLIPLILSTLNILIFSKADPSIIKFITKEINIPSILFGTLLPSMGLVLFLIVMAYFWTFAHLDSKLKSGTFYVLLIISVNYAFLAPLPYSLYPIGLISFMSAVGLGRKLYFEHKGRKIPILTPGQVKIHILNNFFIIAVTLTVNLIQIASHSPWLPLEEITTKNEVVKGYYLGSEDNWANIVTADNEALMLNSDDITSRVVCDQDKTKTIYKLLVEWTTGETQTKKDSCN